MCNALPEGGVPDRSDLIVARFRTLPFQGESESFCANGRAPTSLPAQSWCSRNQMPHSGGPGSPSDEDSIMAPQLHLHRGSLGEGNQ